MRKRIVAGNWKMHTDLHEGYQLMKEMIKEIRSEDLERTEVILFPPFIHLKTFANTINGSGILLGAQNCHYAESGAFTGEISVPMLRSVPVGAVLVGHSERRQYYNETDESVALKLEAATSGELLTILCCGETLEERESNRHFQVVDDQISTALCTLSSENLDRIVIAYEPVWAIGTGVTASEEQAQEMHAFIRGVVAREHGAELAERMRILYGGSVKPGNAAGLFSQPDIDGGLIGGASLKEADFLAIIRA